VTEYGVILLRRGGRPVTPDAGTFVFTGDALPAVATEIHVSQRGAAFSCRAYVIGVDPESPRPIAAREI
jgi:hypothetical protein